MTNVPLVEDIDGGEAGGGPGVYGKSLCIFQCCCEPKTKKIKSIKKKKTMLVSLIALSQTPNILSGMNSQK